MMSAITTCIFGEECTLFLFTDNHGVQKYEQKLDRYKLNTHQILNSAREMKNNLNSMSYIFCSLEGLIPNVIDGIKPFELVVLANQLLNYKINDIMVYIYIYIIGIFEVLGE